MFFSEGLKPPTSDVHDDLIIQKMKVSWDYFHHILWKNNKMFQTTNQLRLMSTPD